MICRSKFEIYYHDSWMYNLFKNMMCEYLNKKKTDKNSWGIFLFQPLAINKAIATIIYQQESYKALFHSFIFPFLFFCSKFICFRMLIKFYSNIKLSVVMWFYIYLCFVCCFQTKTLYLFNMCINYQAFACSFKHLKSGQHQLRHNARRTT